MLNLSYKFCPRCGAKLIFRPLSTLFDSSGKKYGFKQTCSNCAWYNNSRFFLYHEVTKFIDESKVSDSIENRKE